MATFEICEIFSNYYFSYVRDYKATLTGGNKIVAKPISFIVFVYEQTKLKRKKGYKHTKFFELPGSII